MFCSYFSRVIFWGPTLLAGFNNKEEGMFKTIQQTLSLSFLLFCYSTSYNKIMTFQKGCLGLAILSPPSTSVHQIPIIMWNGESQKKSNFNIIKFEKYHESLHFIVSH